jgi:RNA polymerase sigma factor for flagellar operon FliA
LRRNCPLPQRLLEQVAQVRSAYHQLRPGATIEELAAAAGMPVDAVADCLAAARLSSITPTGSGGDWLDNHPAPADDQPDVRAEQAEQTELLAQAIESLAERERLVLTLYYREDLRLKEIGEVLHLSESRICRLLNAALFNVGEYLRGREGAPE